MAAQNAKLVDCPECGNTLRFAAGSTAPQTCPVCGTLTTWDGEVAETGSEPEVAPARGWQSGSETEPGALRPRVVGSAPLLPDLPDEGEDEVSPIEPREAWEAKLAGWRDENEPWDVEPDEWEQDDEHDHEVVMAWEQDHDDKPEAGRKSRNKSKRGDGSRRRRRRRKAAVEIEWESAAAAALRKKRARELRRSGLGKMAAVVTVLGGLGLFGLSVFHASPRTGPEALPGALRAGLGDGSIARLFDGGPPSRELLLRRTSEILEHVRPVLVEFLNATNVEERLELVRDRERVEPLMRAYYERHGDGPIGFRQIAPGGTLAFRDSLAVVEVIMEDWSQRQIAFDLGSDPPPVDWESFVGYSDMLIDELREHQPSEPQLLRALVQWLNPGFYAFDFSDEAALDSYVISDPETGEYLYGYTVRLEPVATRLRELSASSSARPFLAVLKVRFPEDARTDNQVWIDEVLAEGWVLAEENGGELRQPEASEEQP